MTKKDIIEASRRQLRGVPLRSPTTEAMAASQSRRECAQINVNRLEAKLNLLEIEVPTREGQKAIFATKASLRRWLREFPDMNPDLLKAIIQPYRY